LSCRLLFKSQGGGESWFALFADRKFKQAIELLLQVEIKKKKIVSGIFVNPVMKKT